MRILAAPTKRLDAQAGFALIGVVMFVLVLTILGLSLFTLSGFESQFMQSSVDRSEAMFAASGGLDRALFVLARTESLGLVTGNPPIADSVVYALARQEGKPVGPDSLGDINWFGGDILVRVMAQNDGQKKMIEARFHPSGIDLYNRLMTLSGADSGLYVVRRDYDDPSIERWRQVYLFGEVWQNKPNNPNLIFPLGSEPLTPPAPPVNITLRYDGVPSPDVQSFWDRNLAQATEAFGSSKDEFYLDASASPPNNVRFYKSTNTDWTGWSLNIGTEPDDRPRFHVNGTVIWMFERGLRSERTIRVIGSGDPLNDVLVLVARKHASSTSGFVLHGSLESLTVPVILVTDGRVVIQNLLTDKEEPTTIRWLSIYARGPAWLYGPHKNGAAAQPRMTFMHDPTLPGIATILEKLYDLGLLPNLQGGVRGKLQQVAGTWREIPQPN